MGTYGEMIDVGEALDRAVCAARSGDVHRLEVELAVVRRLQAETAASISLKLRSIARAVQTHPSFRPTAAATG